MNYLANQPFVRAEAGYRAAYILWRGDAFDGEYAALADALREGRIIGGTWNHAPDAPLDRAAVGYVVCRATGIRTGLNWQLMGLGRYAWRELQYKEIAGPGSEWSHPTGGEFVGIVSRAEDYQRKLEAVKAPRAELGPPPD